jgi:hypothetical protein
MRVIGGVLKSKKIQNIKQKKNLVTALAYRHTCDCDAAIPSWSTAAGVEAAPNPVAGE